MLRPSSMALRDIPAQLSRLQRHDALLRQLVFPDRAVDEPLLRSLALSLRHNPHFERLYLSKNDIALDLAGSLPPCAEPSENGLQELVDSLVTCPRLTTLWMDSNARLGDAGALRLVARLVPCQLKELRLSGTGVSDAVLAGGPCIPGLCECLALASCQLERLDLMENQLTDEGIFALAAVLSASNRSLRLIWLDKNPGVTQRGVLAMLLALSCNQVVEQVWMDGRNQVREAALCRAVELPQLSPLTMAEDLAGLGREEQELIDNSRGDALRTMLVAKHCQEELRIHRARPFPGRRPRVLDERSGADACIATAEGGGGHGGEDGSENAEASIHYRTLLPLGRHQQQHRELALRLACRHPSSRRPSACFLR